MGVSVPLLCMCIVLTIDIDVHCMQTPLFQAYTALFTNKNLCLLLLPVEILTPSILRRLKNDTEIT